MKVVKVKGHATDEMVTGGTVSWQGKDGNEAAGAALDSGLGRRRQREHII